MNPDADEGAQKSVSRWVGSIQASRHRSLHALAISSDQGKMNLDLRILVLLFLAEFLDVIEGSSWQHNGFSLQRSAGTRRSKLGANFPRGDMPGKRAIRRPSIGFALL
jgi:hypothetical protein